MIDSCVISSNVQFSRNFDGIKFFSKINNVEQSYIINKMQSLLEVKKYTITRLDALDNIEKKALIEQNLITELLAKNNNAAVAISKNHLSSIMINGQDHLCIRFIDNKLDLIANYLEAKQFVEYLSAHVKFSYNDELGYLNSSLANTGSALRISLIIGLPALSKNNKIKKILQKKISGLIAFEAIRANDANEIDCFYQISNIHSVGMSEMEIIMIVNDFAKQIAKLENEERKKMYNQNMNYTKNAVFCSYGIIMNSYLLSYKEFIEHLINIRIGISLELLKNVNFAQIDMAISSLKYFTLCNKNNLLYDKEEYEIIIAREIKKIFKGMIINEI